LKARQRRAFKKPILYNVNCCLCKDILIRGKLKAWTQSTKIFYDLHKKQTVKATHKLPLR
jgi:hypothetical protein